MGKWAQQRSALKVAISNTQLWQGIQSCRARHAPPHPFNTKPTVEPGARGVMLWPCFSAIRVQDLGCRESWSKTLLPPAGAFKMRPYWVFRMTPIPNTPPRQRWSWSSLASLHTSTQQNNCGGSLKPCCQATAPKQHCSGEDLHGRLGQRTKYWVELLSLTKDFFNARIQKFFKNPKMSIPELLFFSHILSV